MDDQMAAPGRDVHSGDDGATRLSSCEGPPTSSSSRNTVQLRASSAVANQNPFASKPPLTTSSCNRAKLAQQLRSASEPFICPPSTTVSVSQKATFPALNTRQLEHHAPQNPPRAGATGIVQSHSATNAPARYDATDRDATTVSGMQSEFNQMSQQLMSSWCQQLPSQHPNLRQPEGMGSIIACQGSARLSIGTTSSLGAPSTSSDLPLCITRGEWNALGSYQGSLPGSYSSLTDDVADVEAALPRPQRVGSFQEGHAWPSTGAAVATTHLLPHCHGDVSSMLSVGKQRREGISTSQAAAATAAMPTETPYLPTGGSSLGTDAALMKELEAFARSLNQGSCSSTSLPNAAAPNTGSRAHSSDGLAAAALLSQAASGSQQDLPFDPSLNNALSALQAPATVLMAQAAGGNQQIAANELLIGLLNGMLPQRTDAGTSSNSPSSRTLPLAIRDEEGKAMQSLLGQLLINQSRESELARMTRDDSCRNELAELLHLQQLALQAMQGQAGVQAGGSPSGSHGGQGLEVEGAASEGEDLESPSQKLDVSMRSKSKAKGRMEAFRLKPRSMKERVRRERISEGLKKLRVCLPYQVSVRTSDTASMIEAAVKFVEDLKGRIAQLEEKAAKEEPTSKPDKDASS